jgi:predicted nucleic acid-binding protein
MSGVLVDTSVWVDHFKKPRPALVHLLTSEQVLVHHYVWGEIACGTPPNRAQTLADLRDLRTPAQPGLNEVLSFVENARLFGLGCGLIDLSLLLSALLTPGSQLWTLDRSLNALALRFGVAHTAPVH